MLGSSIVRDSSLDLFTDTAKGIAFDTCHKIYVLMDDAQVALMREYGYEVMFTSDELTARQMEDKVAEWFEQSCGLRFINAVYSDRSVGHEGFVNIVSQFEGQADEDEDEDED
jgi:hypothetical protein